MTTAAAARRRPRRSVGRTIGRVLFIVLAIIVVAAVAAALFLTWTVQRSFPQRDGDLAVSGLDATVTVQRDDQGIPTITADSATDLFYAQGFVHAQDRFFEMDFRRHVTSGRVAELFGESQVDTDIFLRTLGWRDIAEAEVAAMDETTLSYYQAYADGVNEYLSSRSGSELSLEYAVLGITNPDYQPEPWTPADSVAWLKAMAWDLRSNLGDETTRAVLGSDLLATPELTGDNVAVQSTLQQLYPAYPSEKNPVIVPTVVAPTPPPPPAEEEDDEDSDDSDDDQDSEEDPTPAPTDTPAAAGTADGEQATASVEWKEASTVLEAASLMIGEIGEGIGSNSWVISGDLTESGLPLLANDPHLGSALPSVWYQVQLKCSEVTAECPFDVGGFSFSGLPGVVIGHNATVAWGFTNLGADVADLYVEWIQGDNYVVDNVAYPITVREETIKVAGGDDVDIEVRSTSHGPIVSGLTTEYTAIAESPLLGTSFGMTSAPVLPEGQEYAVALRWTALEPGTASSAIFTLNTAQNFEEFRQAAALFDVPAQNLIYADTEGNIGYQSPGRLPVRGAGDGWLPQPGWDSQYNWQGYIPFDDLPSVQNPSSGYIVTANNAVVDDGYSYKLTRDWDYGYRAARITYLIDRALATGPLTAEDMRSIQMDNEFWIGNRLVSALADVSVEGDGPRQAVDLLTSWDAQNAPDSAAAAYANVLFARLAQNLFAARETPLPISNHARLFTVISALLDNPDDPLWTNEEINVQSKEDMLALSAEQAYNDLVTLQGNVVSRWNWGALHAINLRSETLGSSGIAAVEMLFNRGPYSVGGGSSVVNATGWNIGDGSYETTTVPSLRMVVDLADLDASTWNHLTGASGHAFHENYVDQTEDWAAGIQQTWAFTPEAVNAAAVHTLRLVPQG